ncbi:MAG: glycerophosphodiester phosphodiesterase family protein [Acidobacteria bacterium]|nr:glycerophosphodiester phosphodiesterase family protein [Acidobacteriota bacterium]
MTTPLRIALAAATVVLAPAFTAGQTAAPAARDGRSACLEVIAHRGASGYLPEHTLPAYALGYGQGAGWIEPDVVLTADRVAIALHDVTLDRTTDVAERYPDRAREDGRYYAADFTFAELERLRVVESRPGRFPHTTFRVPRLTEVLDLVEGLNRTTGRRAGVYPELKSPDIQPGLGDAVLDALAGYDLPVLIQSFDANALAALVTDLPRVQLITSPAQLEPAGLDAIAGYAVAIGAPTILIYRDPAIVARAHERDLAVHAYTLRADQLAPGFDSLAAEVEALLAAGVDAVFTDHPDQVLALAAAHGAACSPASEAGAEPR